MPKQLIVITSYSIHYTKLYDYSVLAELIPVPKAQDMFLGCVYGGVLVGAGVGVVVRSGGSTGGTDMAAKMLSARYKSIGIGTFVFAIDFFVIAAAGFVITSYSIHYTKLYE